MNYQVRVNLFFPEEEQARRVFAYNAKAYANALDLKPDTLATEFSSVELIENRHDEAPSAPCDCIERRCSYP